MTEPLPLIDKLDTSEVVRDKIAEILVTESALQQALATAASKDPRLWELRVFTERANPWGEFQAPISDQVDAIPIINVAVDNLNYDPSGSNVIERQKTTGLYNIDCYGYGVSQTDGASGHLPGDRRSALEAQRAVRLVRNILMAATYTYLDLRGTVWGRWFQSVQVFQPPIDANAVMHVVGARVSFRVVFNEFSPQVTGEVLEEIGVTVKRAETGEVLLLADYDAGDWT